VAISAQVVLIHPRKRQRVFDNDNACLFWHFAVHVPIYSSIGTIPIVTLHAQLLTSSQLIRYLIEISFWLKKA
jgi:hypothetical protein